ncbi:MAG: hypothetical protein PHU73_00170, partial [Patescibacteria group bacterium]|nr:hypothetical protein [Patescibacteria group bacterium]
DNDVIKLKNKFLNFILKILRLPNRDFLINSLLIVSTLFIYYYSISFILHGSEEGLIYSYETQRLAKIEQNKLLNSTENNSAIITFYADKIIFPERKIIIGNLNDPEMNKIYAKLSDYLPVYYYHFSLTGEDIEYLNNTKFRDLNIQIKKIARITKDFTLYKIIKK